MTLDRENGGSRLRALLLERPDTRRVLRLYAVGLAVVLLCGVVYLAGIWTGTGLRETRCVTESPGVLVCGTDVPEPAPGVNPPVDPERRDV